MELFSAANHHSAKHVPARVYDNLTSPYYSEISRRAASLEKDTTGKGLDVLRWTQVALGQVVRHATEANRLNDEVTNAFKEAGMGGVAGEAYVHEELVRKAKNLNRHIVYPNVMSIADHLARAAVNMNVVHDMHREVLGEDHPLTQHFDRELVGLNKEHETYISLMGIKNDIDFENIMKNNNLNPDQFK